VVLLHNYPTPYRMPLFDELAKDVALDVWFCSKQEGARRWASSPELTLGTSRTLPVRVLGWIFVNWSLPLHLARLQTDAVIIAEDLPMILSSALTAAACRWKGIPLVVWSEHVRAATLAPNGMRAGQRGRARLKHWMSRLKHWMYSWVRVRILRRARVVLAMSGAASEQELASLIGSATIPVVAGPQVVPISQMPLGTATDPSPTPRFLFLGYLRPEKNVDSLIRAFSQLEPGSATLVIGGDGPEREALRALARDVTGIEFAGYLEGVAKAQELALATALVLPSTYEPWGLVVNEGLYVGTPVLVSSVAGAAELIQPGGNGFVFDVSTGDRELRDILGALSRQPELRARLSHATRSADKTHLCDLRIGSAHILQAIRMAVEPIG
jgi:glycosyltransferase involved in cell wall biosynthesis